MKILHVLRSDGFAGVERHIATLAVAQARQGDEVTVIGGDQVHMRAAFRGTPVEAASGNTVAQVMHQVLRHQGVDVVHAHMTAGELAAVLTTTSPVVVTRHFARHRGSTIGGQVAARFIARRISAQIAISNYVASAVDGPCVVIYPGVRPVTNKPAHRNPVVLVVQRLQPEKETHIALRAFAAGAPESWTLKIVGDGGDLGALKQLATQLGIEDRTRFLGFRSDVPNLMGAASVLLAPCTVEGLGLSVLEAMSHALPVVASRAGAHTETVGLAADSQLFSPGDAIGAADLLARLCVDPALRSRYGQQLMSVQRTHFTPTAQARATDAVYQKAVA